jgi:tRNA 2-thiouridine synthesizing protein A
MTRPPVPTAEAQPAAEAHLDARGLLCPVPVLLAAREIAKLPAGGRLVVEGDDPGILEDLPAWCAETGHRLVTIGAQGGLVRGVVEKAGEEGRHA